ncbi:tumor necrosis factor receptor superfamily [Pimephales promelas]|nr:tumor necrosis factor receptor superfamily [Pimephales promelas]
MKTVFVIYLLVTLLHFVLCCEEEMHYKNKNGDCCKKCGPGKRMMMDDNCQDPRCQDCRIGEYQSGYTSNTRCERQPSCDANLHLKPQEDIPITTRLNKCVCEPGYYCTKEDDCSACMEHSVCKPGERVAKKGTQESDTKCEPCKNGTFSDHDSADTCKEWTTCDYGYDQNTPGSSTSDRSCCE